jgi:hypothetical protein
MSPLYRRFTKFKLTEFKSYTNLRSQLKNSKSLPCPENSNRTHSPSTHPLARPLHQLSAPLDPPPKRPATRKLLTNKRNSQRLGSGFESITKRASYAHVPLLLCLFSCTNDIAFMSFCHVKGSGPCRPWSALSCYMNFLEPRSKAWEGGWSSLWLVNGVTLTTK